jgi:hypothetical protein
MNIPQRRKELQEKRSQKSPEEVLKEAKSWQLVLAAIVTSTIGFYLSQPVGRAALGLADAWLHDGHKALPNFTSKIDLALLYGLAWIAYTALDLTKDFLKELRRRWIRL